MAPAPSSTPKAEEAVTAISKAYSAAEQERLIRSAMPVAGFRLSCLLHRKMGAIVDLAIYRGVTLGVKQYGDASFHKTMEELEREAWEELADGVMYQAIYHLKETKVIP